MESKISEVNAQIFLFGLCEYILMGISLLEKDFLVLSVGYLPKILLNGYNK
jgi:hypothetical protein